MVGSICKDSHKVAHLGKEVFSGQCSLATIFDQGRNDALDSLFDRGQLLLLVGCATTDLVDDTRTVGIVSLEDIRAHECENGHDVLHDLIWNKLDKLGDQCQSLIGSCWVVRDYHMNDQQCDSL